MKQLGQTPLLKTPASDIENVANVSKAQNYTVSGEESPKLRRQNKKQKKKKKAKTSENMFDMS